MAGVSTNEARNEADLIADDVIQISFMLCSWFSQKFAPRQTVYYFLLHLFWFHKSCAMITNRNEAIQLILWPLCHIIDGLMKGGRGGQVEGGEERENRQTSRDKRKGGRSARYN